MASPSQPKGIDSSMLESMRQQTDFVNSRAGGNVSGGYGIEGGIGAGGEMIAGIGKHALDFGIGGEGIKLAIMEGGGVFNKNMFNDIFDGTLVGPGNINAFAGMGHYNAMGNLSLSEGATIGSGLNIANQISAIHNPSRSGGQGH